MFMLHSRCPPSTTLFRSLSLRRMSKLLTVPVLRPERYVRCCGQHFSTVVKQESTESPCTSTSSPKLVRMKWIEPDGTEIDVDAKEDQSLLDVAIEHEIDLEGACEGSLACSTCHVILEQAVFDSLPEAEEEEDDMLDLAYGLTE
eukprot:42054_1